MAQLTSAAMAAIIAGGGVVYWNGQILTTPAQVPTDAQIAAAAAVTATPPVVLSNGLAVPAASMVGAVQQKYNGATLDLVMNNMQAVLAPPGPRTVAPPIATQVNTDARGVLLFLNITASPANAAAALALVVNAVEPVTGTALVPLFAPTAISATAAANAVTGVYGFLLVPGAASVAAATKNGAPASAGLSLPRVWSVALTPATPDSWTYSLAYQSLA